MKPMLACECPLDQLKLPLLGSPKLDGIRAETIHSVAYSRSMKPIRNRWIQTCIADYHLHGLDGELTVGSNFQECSSGVMSFDGEPDFTYWVFDKWDTPDLPYLHRLRDLSLLTEARGASFVKVLPQVMLYSVEDVLKFEEKCLLEGYEGIILRRSDAPYKHGRSTPKEQYLIKRKPFADDEATITATFEQLENTNVLGVNELGNAKRSGMADGMVPKGTLGGFTVTHPTFGEFNIGTGKGLTQELRQSIWDNREDYIGKLVKFKYQAFGVKDKPRLPIFLGFRHPEDL